MGRFPRYEEDDFRQLTAEIVGALLSAFVTPANRVLSEEMDLT